MNYILIRRRKLGKEPLGVHTQTDNHVKTGRRPVSEPQRNASGIQPCPDLACGFQPWREEVSAACAPVCGPLSHWARAAGDFEASLGCWADVPGIWCGGPGLGLCAETWSLHLAWRSEDLVATIDPDRDHLHALGAWSQGWDSPLCRRSSVQVRSDFLGCGAKELRLGVSAK